MILTREQLVKMKACPAAIDAFTRAFGGKASIEDVVAELHRRLNRNWEAWLLAQNVRLTKALIKAGANVRAHFDSAICWAAERNKTKVIDVLIKAGANIHSAEETAFRSAVIWSCFAAAKQLINAGANIHVLNDSTLHLAISGKRYNMVRILVKAGADVSAVENLIEGLVQNKNTRMLKALGLQDRLKRSKQKTKKQI